MLSSRNALQTIDDDHVDRPLGTTDDEGTGTDAIALAEAAADEAEALATAARARAQAIRLRREAETTQPAPAQDPDPAEATDLVTVTEDDAATADVEGTTEPVGESTAHRFLRLPGWRAVALGIAILCTCALLVASGYLTWLHRQAEARHHHAAEFVAAARQVVVTLMSIDSTKAKDQVQRIIDGSTGQFRKDFQSAADDFIKVAQDSKVSTTATVQGAAVQSMTEDSATVLVAATSTISNAAGANQQPRSWRLNVNLTREGGQIKMSSMEFVP